MLGLETPKASQVPVMPLLAAHRRSHIVSPIVSRQPRLRLRTSLRSRSRSRSRRSSRLPPLNSAGGLSCRCPQLSPCVRAMSWLNPAMFGRRQHRRCMPLRPRCRQVRRHSGSKLSRWHHPPSQAMWPQWLVLHRQQRRCVVHCNHLAVPPRWHRWQAVRPRRLFNRVRALRRPRRRSRLRRRLSPHASRRASHVFQWPRLQPTRLQSDLLARHLLPRVACTVRPRHNQAFPPPMLRRHRWRTQWMCRHHQDHRQLCCRWMCHCRRRATQCLHH